MTDFYTQWIRGFAKIDLDKPNIFTGTGIRGSGKSNLNELFGEAYLDAGHSVLDLFGARDGEGLAWLRSPYKNQCKFLLLHGDNVEVTKAPCETRPTSKVTNRDLKVFDVVISSAPLYSSSDDEFQRVGELLNDIFYRRLSWKRLIYCIVREASNLFFSRVRATNSQTQAKANMIYLIRESRHVGLALGMDTLRTKAVDIDIRELTDYLFFKTIGFYGLHQDFRFLYSFFKPDAIRKMPTDKFLLLTQPGDIGVGHCDLVSFHKKEHENLLEILGREVEYKAPVRLGTDRGGYRTIGDAEHVKIITMYAEDNLSYVKIGHALGRSSKTPFDVVLRHNEAVETGGFCPVCRRGEGEYETSPVKRGMVKG